MNRTETVKELDANFSVRIFMMKITKTENLKQ